MTPSEMRVPAAPRERPPAPDSTVSALPSGEIQLVINGEHRTAPAGATIADVLAALALDPRAVVVEHNREILRDRASYGVRGVQRGDVLEVVHFVGGG